MKITIIIIDDKPAGGATIPAEHLEYIRRREERKRLRLPQPNVLPTKEAMDRFQKMAEAWSQSIDAKEKRRKHMRTLSIDERVEIIEKLHAFGQTMREARHRLAAA